MINLIDSLGDLQKKLVKEHPYFPDNCCSLSAIKIFNELKIPFVGGFILTLDGFKDHAWNITKEEEIVDITLIQYLKNYNKYVPNIIVMPKDYAILNFGYVDVPKKTEAIEKFIINNSLLKTKKLNFLQL